MTLSLGGTIDPYTKTPKLRISITLQGKTRVNKRRKKGDEIRKVLSK